MYVHTIVFKKDSNEQRPVLVAQAIVDPNVRARSLNHPALDRAPREKYERPNRKENIPRVRTISEMNAAEDRRRRYRRHEKMRPNAEDKREETMQWRCVVLLLLLLFALQRNVDRQE